MTNDILSTKRAAYCAALTKTWNLFDNVQTFVRGEKSDEKIPDFSEIASHVIVDEQELLLREHQERVHRSSLEQLATIVNECTLCNLCTTRTHAVFGEGTKNPKVMIIGEAPGADEDMQGKPFVGKAGRYLDSWLQAIHLTRTRHVYITNIVKCRPPENRNPYLEEAETCIEYLKKQISLVKPETILCVGLVSSQHLLQKTDSLHQMRGVFHRYQGIPVLVTYHPAGVLRNPQYRGAVWEDLQKLASFLDLPIVQKGR